MPKRICNHPRCHKLIPFKERYCETHKREEVADRRRAYDETRDKKYKDFYQTKEWKYKRGRVLERDNYLCQHCLKNMIFKAADVVHHIIEIKCAWSLRLEEKNLLSLCHACHNEIHHSKEG